MGFLEILLLVGWFALLMLSIMAYFFFRRKFAYTKAIMEFVFIAAVLIFSVAVKAVVWGVNAGGTLTLSKFFEALYTGIGGLTFEGLPDAATGVGKEVSEISLILFYGAPLYAGIMTLFILSARASYEFYSIPLKTNRPSLPIFIKRSIFYWKKFVFTDSLHTFAIRQETRTLVTH